jgi:hypothetical protein
MEAATRLSDNHFCAAPWTSHRTIEGGIPGPYIFNPCFLAGAPFCQTQNKRSEGKKKQDGGK